MTQDYGEFETRELPPPPHWKDALGVGVVIVGLSIGTGELIMWPHLVTKFGFGVLWAALLGITFQYFINQEVARHSIATGESFFTSTSRMLKWFAPFWIISSVMLYVWPGWASTIGTILKELFGFGNYISWAFVSLLGVLVLTFSGKIAYQILEKTLKIIVPTFFLLLLVSSFYNVSTTDFSGMFKGILNFGFFPKGIDMAVFLGAIVFAGAGGMLNLCTSLWYRDKQTGMGKYVGRIINPITGKNESVSITSYRFDINDENISRWKKWMRFIRIDQGIIFWFLGLTTLLLLSVNAYATLTPKGLVPDGLNIAVVQAHIFGDSMGPIGANVFLIMAFLMLFSVMWTVLDAFTRIVSDIIYVNSHIGPFKKYLTLFKEIPASKLYYSSIVILVFTSALLLPMQQPLVLLTISAALGGITMGIYTPVLIYLNNTKLEKELRPGIFTNIMMGGATVFYWYFIAYLLLSYIK